MRTVRVTNLEQFRIWRDDEELEVGWLLARLRGDDAPSEAMQAGTAFHAALESAPECELGTLASGDYRFDFNCDCEIPIPTLKELAIEKQYGNLLVTGHVDGLIGREVVDYKTTSQFDPDRYLAGYQWRFYLDMLNADRFRWEIFVLAEFGPEYCYSVKQAHRLMQSRYPNLHDDCMKLAREYNEFAEKYMT